MFMPDELQSIAGAQQRSLFVRQGPSQESQATIWAPVEWDLDEGHGIRPRGFQARVAIRVNQRSARRVARTS